MSVQVFNDTVLISDIHGYLDEFQTVLQSQGLIDKENNWIGGKHKRLILMGDFVDRGPKSVETYMYFRALQQQLGKEQVTMLFGNHDIQYFGGPLAQIEAEVKDKLATIMRQDAAQGNLQAATTVKMENEDFLVVHGGLHPGHDLNSLGVHGASARLNELGEDFAANGAQHMEIVAVGLARAPYIQREIHKAIDDANIDDSQKLELMHQQPTLQMLKDLNKEKKLGRLGFKILTNAAMSGVSDTPGITWCDVNDDLSSCDPADLLPQVVGHRQQRDGINLKCDGKVWAVNVPYGDAQSLRVSKDGIATPTPRYHASIKGFEQEVAPEKELEDISQDFDF